MIITINYIKQAFQKYNNIYFNGILIEPQFKISRSKQTLGRFVIKRVASTKQIISKTIEISKYYVCTEKQYDNTIIHEMIHLYIDQLGINDTSAHGVEFMKIAKRINKDGWEIAVCNSRENCLLTNGDKKQYHVFIIHSLNNQYFMFVSATTSIDSFKKFLERRKYTYDYFMSKDTNTFDKFTVCRRKLTGKYLTQSEYKNIIINQYNLKS